MDHEGRSSKCKVYRWFLVAAVTVAYLLVGLYPYEWRSPLPKNHAERMSSGALRFGGPGIAETRGAPAWTDTVRRSHQLEVSLRVRPKRTSQTGPARIFTISKDPYRRNLTVAQEHDRLVLRLRTAETDGNGLPEYEIPKVFNYRRWIDINVCIMPRRIVVMVNGEARLDDRLPQAPLTSFNTSYRLAFGNELTGDRPWLGEIARATVTTAERRINYLDPARLKLPARLRYFHNRPQLIPFEDLAVKDAVVNLLGFVPFGMLVGWLFLEQKRRLSVLAILPVFLLSAGIELIQWSIPARYASVNDLIMNTIGGGLGLITAKVIWQRHHMRSPMRSVDPRSD